MRTHAEHMHCNTLNSEIAVYALGVCYVEVVSLVIHGRKELATP